MNIQEFNALLQSMGLGGDPSQLSGGQIMTGVGTPYGSEVMGLLDPSMFQTISPDLMRGASISGYSPLFQQGQQNLMGGLLANLQGKGVRQAHGKGFAGTGAAALAGAQARDVYGKGMQDVVGQAAQGVGQSQQTLADIYSQWQQTAQSFVG